MPVELQAPRADELHPVPGIRLGVAEAGIRKANRKDLTVILLPENASVAGVFTQNRYCAAPVQVCRAHLAQTPAAIRALVINTGNANAGTGQAGLDVARQTCAALAQQLGIQPQQVLPFSTGVIMESLPVDKIVSALPAAVAHAAEGNWLEAAQAIMTTDTVPKACSQQIEIDGHTVTITGISKGAGMIQPNMATMLGFLATDARIAPELMPDLVRELADASFNRITIDGDTSTNDSFMLISSQQAEHACIQNWHSPQAKALKTALLQIAEQLAQAIVRDGEGASKFITIHVTGGRTEEECRQVAYSVANSPLVKTAFFASDPNLGRILAAVGYAGIADLEQEKIELYLDDVHVVTAGGRHPAYQEEQGQRVMKKNEITVQIQIGRGSASSTVWTCDLSHDYVSINADYRS